MKRFSDVHISDELDFCSLATVELNDCHDYWDKEDAAQVINHLLKVFDIRIEDIEQIKKG